MAPRPDAAHPDGRAALWRCWQPSPSPVPRPRCQSFAFRWRFRRARDRSAAHQFSGGSLRRPGRGTPPLRGRARPFCAGPSASGFRASARAARRLHARPGPAGPRPGSPAPPRGRRARRSAPPQRPRQAALRCKRRATATGERRANPSGCWRQNPGTRDRSTGPPSSASREERAVDGSSQSSSVLWAEPLCVEAVLSTSSTGGAGRFWRDAPTRQRASSVRWSPNRARSLPAPDCRSGPPRSSRRKRNPATRRAGGASRPRLCCRYPPRGRKPSRPSRFSAGCLRRPGSGPGTARR